jgi:hypothetical protein
MENKSIILTTAYLPPIQYFAKLIGYSNITIEAFDTYAKQSYRNRCIILSCNGPLSLTIPVIKSNGNHTLVKDVKIDYSTNWQKNHLKAIESAYKTSAFFDFVADTLFPFYKSREQFLLDYNTKIVIELLKFLGVDQTLQSSTFYLKEYPVNCNDYRNIIHPKPQYQADDKQFEPVNYFQIFSDRFDFLPNLSILDLLCNEGLNSLNVLEQTIKK